MGRIATRQVDGFVIHGIGKGAATIAGAAVDAVVLNVARVHREAFFVAGNGSDHQLVWPADHSRKGSVEVVEVCLVAAAASAIVRSSSAAHNGTCSVRVRVVCSL